MKIIGFNFEKIHAEKSSTMAGPSINNNVQFTDLDKESMDLFKEDEILKLSFKYSLLYSNKTDAKEIKDEEKDAEVSFEGHLLLMVDKEESKNFEEAWKNKEVPKEKIASLYNMIFKRCGAKAIPLQEDLGIPSPFLKVPQAKAQ